MKLANEDTLRLKVEDGRSGDIIVTKISGHDPITVFFTGSGMLE